MDSYLTLFFSAFLAATLLPLGSEVLLLSLAASGDSLWLLWIWATAGNTLGSMVNYGLGRYFLHYQHLRWFPFKSDRLHTSQRWFQRYGYWSLLFAWLPILGDALTFIAGMMRLSFIGFCILVAIGKGIRYGILLGGLSWLGGA